MSNADSLVFLVTGAARGIGRGLVDALVKRPNTIVIAAVRTLDDANAKALGEVATSKGSKVIVIKLNSADQKDAERAVKTLQHDHGVYRIDVVFANAGVNRSTESVLTTTPDDIRESVEINATAPLLLFQATRSLLLASSAATQGKTLPKFIICSSAAGSMVNIGQSGLSNLSYSLSKAAVNVVGIRLAVEEKDVITLLVHPGLVDTPMVNNFKERFPHVAEYIDGLKPIKPEESALKFVELAYKATRADSGRFLDVMTGEDLPW